MEYYMADGDETPVTDDIVESEDTVEEDDIEDEEAEDDDLDEDDVDEEIAEIIPESEGNDND